MVPEGQRCYESIVSERLRFSSDLNGGCVSILLRTLVETAFDKSISFGRRVSETIGQTVNRRDVCKILYLSRTSFSPKHLNRV